jgi:alkanesulfonate monooxygenase SsuD/methylene tetrahydromethanopterin reductase-like flavin-dependent oxidoreductase (luciferase family)
VRHAVCVANVGTYGDPRAILRVAEVAEETGWDGFFCWDHLAFAWDAPACDPWVALAAVAARTSRLTLGATVTPVARRRPQVLAQTVASLDLLSGGRVVFAAGLGGREVEFTAFGEDADPRRRALLLDEGLELLCRLWRGERVVHRGALVVDGVTLAPLPKRQPPIWIGGDSEAALRRAARYDGWVADSVAPDRMKLEPSDVAARVATIGRGTGFDVVVNGYSERGDRDLIAAYREAGATWWLENVHDLRGSAEQMLERVAAGPAAV